MFCDDYGINSFECTDCFGSQYDECKCCIGLYTALKIDTVLGKDMHLAFMQQVHITLVTQE